MTIFSMFFVRSLLDFFTDMGRILEGFWQHFVMFFWCNLTDKRSMSSYFIFNEHRSHFRGKCYLHDFQTSSKSIQKQLFVFMIFEI